MRKLETNMSPEGSIVRPSSSSRPGNSVPKVLLTDDDPQLLNLITDWLEYQNFEIVKARNGIECREFLSKASYDVLILDWQMPDITGIEICRWFRNQGGNTPILMLTAKHQIECKEIGLAAGADDYMTKPFELRELTLRVNALLRRSTAAFSRVVQVGPLILDPATHAASIDGHELVLTATEFAVLEYMARHANQVFSTKVLLERVWKRASGVSPDTVRVYLRRLKDKLEAFGHRDLIQNVHGVGYKIDSSACSSMNAVPASCVPMAQAVNFSCT